MLYVQLGKNLHYLDSQERSQKMLHQIFDHLQNAIFKFLSKNNYIEHQIQKDLTPKVPWTLKHTTQMLTISKKACFKQCSLVITFLDLKNAFGEVYHILINEIL